MSNEQLPVLHGMQKKAINVTNVKPMTWSVMLTVKKLNAKIKTPMKKQLLLLLLLVSFTFLFTNSCSSDDDNSSSGNSLKGTAWLGTADDEGEVYNFTTSSDYIFNGEGVTRSGTYTFNGSTGVLTGENYSFDFTVDNNVMTVDNGDMSTYIKQ